MNGLLPETVGAEDIASAIGCSVRNAKDRVTKEPSFPKPIKIGRHRRWIKTEVSAWMMKQREK